MRCEKGALRKAVAAWNRRSRATVNPSATVVADDTGPLPTTMLLRACVIGSGTKPGRCHNAPRNRWVLRIHRLSAWELPTPTPSAATSDAHCIPSCYGMLSTSYDGFGYRIPEATRQKSLGPQYVVTPKR